MHDLNLFSLLRGDNNRQLPKRVKPSDPADYLSAAQRTAASEQNERQPENWIPKTAVTRPS